MKYFLIICFAIVSNASFTQEIKSLTWSDLKVKMDFDDPFTKLSSKQLYNLGQVANIRERQKNPEDELSQYSLSLKDSLENQLIAEGIDIDGLIAQRYEIAALRQKQFEAVDTALNNTNIHIEGYLLPLNYVDNKTTEFLLVPWVGACIHTPPPPKNQLIYVYTNEGYEVKSRFQPVSVEGIIATQSRISTLYLVDGSDEISSGYSMLEVKIREL